LHRSTAFVEAAPYVHASISPPAQLGQGDLTAMERERRWTL